MTPSAWRVRAQDDHEWDLVAVEAAAPRQTLLWLPALGVAARHYLPLAHALATRGISVAVHEWRGHGTSTQRASRRTDWGYRDLLEHDLPASIDVLQARSGMQTISIGGHSLGGQLACCSAALSPHRIRSMHLVASGAPYWRAFPSPRRYGLPFAYRFLPWLARAIGALPGRRIGFGGMEAAGVVRDWARTALTGRYEVKGWEVEVDRMLGMVHAPVTAITLDEDWLAPATSLDFLLGTMPLAPTRVSSIDSARLGVRADHFAWMQAPDAIAETLFDL